MVRARMLTEEEAHALAEHVDGGGRVHRTPATIKADQLGLGSLTRHAFVLNEHWADALRRYGEGERHPGGVIERMVAAKMLSHSHAELLYTHVANAHKMTLTKPALDHLGRDALAAAELRDALEVAERLKLVRYTGSSHVMGREWAEQLSNYLRRAELGQPQGSLELHGAPREPKRAGGPAPKFPAASRTGQPGNHKPRDDLHPPRGSGPRLKPRG